MDRSRDLVDESYKRRGFEDWRGMENEAGISDLGDAHASELAWGERSEREEKLRVKSDLRSLGRRRRAMTPRAQEKR